MKKVLTNYDKLREAETLTTGRSIALQTGDNAFFPNLSPTLLVFTENLDDYAAQLTAAQMGDKAAKARKDLANKLVKRNLTDWALYVNSVAKGDLVILSTTGMPLAADRNRIIITAPVIKSLDQGTNAGSVVVKVGRVKGAKSYQYQYAVETPAGRSEWVTVTDSRSKVEISELEQGKMYWFKVAAIGGNGQTVYSTEMAVFVMQRNLRNAA